MTKHEFFYEFHSATGKTLKKVKYTWDSWNFIYNITAFLVAIRDNAMDCSDMLVLEGESENRENLYTRKMLNKLIKLYEETQAYKEKLKNDNVSTGI